MPLKLHAPRADKNSPNWTIRGRYLGVDINKTSGTHKRSVALKALQRIEREIESGKHGRTVSNPDAPTFDRAALAYLEAGHNPRYVAPLVKYFGPTLLAEIDQRAIDTAAVDLHPRVKPATRNVYVYTPMSAILHHAGLDVTVRRPKGAKGEVRTNYLTPEDAWALVKAGEQQHKELGVLLQFLLLTGVRISEALSLRWQDVRLAEGTAWVRYSKNGDPRTVRLHTSLIEALEAHGRQGERVFNLRHGGWLKFQFLNAKLSVCGLPLATRPKKGQKLKVPPYRMKDVTFHTFRHTWATWMRKYGGKDLQGLVGTGNWRDPRSAARYAHVVARDEWAGVESFPLRKAGQ